MIIIKFLDEYLKYLDVQKNYSNYTIRSYKKDILEFLTFLDKHKIDILNVEYENIKLFLKEQNSKKNKSSTLSRKISFSNTTNPFQCY